MKILIVLKKFKGGVGRSNQTLSKFLIKKGHEVKILSREEDLKKYGLRDSIFPIRSIVKKIMKKENYDIVYSQDWSIAFPLLFPYPLFKNKHFVCFCGRETTGIPKLMQKLVGKIMKRRLVVIGDQLKKDFPRGKLIYRGIDLEEFKPLKNKRNYLGWIKRDWEILSECEVSDLARNLGLKLKVAEGIPPRKMNRFYNSCRIFISTPKTAGYNNCWNEAMASGVPIILGNYEGAGSFLPFEKISNPFTMERAENILKHAKKKDYRKWLINNKFSWEYKSQKLVKFFEMGLKK